MSLIKNIIRSGLFLTKIPNRKYASNSFSGWVSVWGPQRSSNPHFSGQTEISMKFSMRILKTFKFWEERELSLCKTIYLFSRIHQKSSKFFHSQIKTSNCWAFFSPLGCRISTVSQKQKENRHFCLAAKFRVIKCYFHKIYIR